MRFVLGCVLLSGFLMAGCGGGSNSEPEIDVNEIVESAVEAASTEAPASASSMPAQENNTRAQIAISSPPLAPEAISSAIIFLLSPDMCDGDDGPNCSKLPLGDDYLTTDTPARGYLYSCIGQNPNAPGSNESKITWVNFVEKTWNFLEKLWLPFGTFSAGTGVYSENVLGSERLIEINNLPVDEKIGDWPMTNYPTLSEIDPNPGIPISSSSSFKYPVNPSKAPSPTCLSLGVIGVTKNGVVIYNAADGRGEDAMAREIVDVFGGHPARDEYHYHFIPERLDNEYLGDGHSGIVGYISDGFPIYGYRGEGGREMSNEGLDECHGHDHGSLGYHYHATIEYPYTVGCYKGSSSELPGQGGPLQDRPRRRQ